ncbi:MAG: UbiA family prenyltransferase [Candidatus Delongbacteria bacterium]|nr:UbiA family prenyltransferase [Candidatus Delongbacteria bacterium]
MLYRADILNFIKQYVKSMRLYYSFVTGIAGWLGFAFYEHIATDFRTVEIFPSAEKKALIISILFLSWGINQIVNDYLGMKEDRINAPDRPMVSGKLNPKGALIVSFILMLFVLGITYFYLEPIAIIPLAAGVLLNFIYEYSKAFGIWGNIIFGLMITMCTAFGFLAAGPTQAPYFTQSRIAVLSVVWLMNGLMTFYTYFKDYEGDKATGKNTIVVKYGIERSRFIAIFSAFLPVILFVIINRLNLIEAPLNNTFYILGVLTLFLEIQTGWLYFKNPEGKVTYYSLATNFRACTCGQATFVSLFNQELALILFLISYIFVGFLFNFHNNSKA